MRLRAESVLSTKKDAIVQLVLEVRALKYAQTLNSCMHCNFLRQYEDRRNGAKAQKWWLNLALSCYPHSA